MTYNQEQSFQINDYENHYEDIEITGYRAIHRKSIAGRGIARLISWLGTAGPVDCFNNTGKNVEFPGLKTARNVKEIFE